MTISSKHIAKHFNQAAPTYDKAAFLQKEISRRLITRASTVKATPNYIVDIGCGTGGNTANIIEQFPDSHVLALDIAPAMAQQTKKSCNISVLCADMHALPLHNNSADMVISNCVLQWSHDPAKYLKQCYKILKPGGTLFLSSFGPDTLKELRLAFSHSPYQHVHRFTDMHDIGDTCLSQGFHDPVLDRDDITVTYPSVKTIIGDLKKLGATNQDTKRPPGLMGKATWSKMLSNYEMLKAENGQYPVSYEVFYCHATKPQTSEIPTTIAQTASTAN